MALEHNREAPRATADLLDATIQNAFSTSLELHGQLASMTAQQSAGVERAIASMNDIVRDLRKLALRLPEKSTGDESDVWRRFAAMVEPVIAAHGDRVHLTIKRPSFDADAETLAEAATELGEIMVLLRDETLAATHIQLGGRLVMTIEAPDMIDAFCALRDLPDVQVVTRRSTSPARTNDPESCGG